MNLRSKHPELRLTSDYQPILVPAEDACAAHLVECAPALMLQPSNDRVSGT
ncbi:MAG: hypothetical protein ACI87O_003263, partial [Planctomycetota bacterium]